MFDSIPSVTQNKNNFKKRNKRSKEQTGEIPTGKKNIPPLCLTISIHPQWRPPARVGLVGLQVRCLDRAPRNFLHGENRKENHTRAN